ncbi:hypothetical protein RUM43_013614 [Polyplax serrata]|uniref:Uncharacterized protein n=1 Tax=Polyplax serrata TaxID=468196 RepID=A0AAN8PT32_POLSC
MEYSVSSLMADAIQPINIPFALLERTEIYYSTVKEYDGDLGFSFARSRRSRSQRRWKKARAGAAAERERGESFQKWTSSIPPAFLARDAARMMNRSGLQEPFLHFWENWEVGESN